MGAWAVDAFGNDDACDWAFGLEDVEDLSLIESALDALLASGGEYLEAAEAAEALAAVEVMARLMGHWGERNAYTEDVDRWVEKTKAQPSAALMNKAHRVIVRILGEDSELDDLWRESEEYDAWRASVEDLNQRISG